MKSSILPRTPMKPSGSSSTSSSSSSSSISSSSNNISNVNSSSNSSGSGLLSKNVMVICMLADGIGLAIIGACTILDGMDLWRDFFNEFWNSNSSSLGFWFCGRLLQIVGILLLISFAAIFQNHAFSDIERLGMVFLTVGPILNIISCSLFDNNVNMTDPFFLFNKQWVTNELLELFGIIVLDLSLIDTEEHLVLLFEVAGFSILAIAAATDFTYSIDEKWPSVSIRMDFIHLSDCFGLFLLTVVAVLQYHIKIEKHHAIEANRELHSNSEINSNGITYNSSFNNSNSSGNSNSSSNINKISSGSWLSSNSSSDQDYNSLDRRA